MRSAASHSRHLRRPRSRDSTRSERHSLGARGLLAALLGVIAPGSAATRLSEELSMLNGTLADHSMSGDEQSVGDMMAAIDAVRRAIDDAAPEERAMLARAIRDAGQI